MANGKIMKINARIFPKQYPTDQCSSYGILNLGMMAKHGWKGFGIHPHIAENQPHEVSTLGMNHPV